MKVSAEQFAQVGFNYLGTSYKTMDCQAFVERCMADCGLKKDLGGSNSWYRAMTWTGTPEECKAKFGTIPKGAILYIWEPVSETTPEKFRHDGVGDITHMGIKTGTGKGAIHSSRTMKGVAESAFSDKTIKNGGWNRVGLYSPFDYGEKVNSLLEGGESGEGDEESGGTEPMTQKAKVWSYNGQPVKMRQKPSESCNLYENILNGETVDVVKRGETWTKINAAGRSGWYMKTVFLVFGEVIPDDPDNQDGGSTDPVDDFEITIKVRAEDAETILDFLDDLANKIALITGRG